jgi:hypothetical protein
LEQSLKRGLEFLKSQRAGAGLDDDDLEQADLEQDVGEAPIEGPTSSPKRRSGTSSGSCGTSDLSPLTQG